MSTLKMVLHVEKTSKSTIQEELRKFQKFARKISMAEFSLGGFIITLFHSNLDEKITSNEQKVTSNEQKVTNNEEKITSNKQKVTSNEQGAKSNEQRPKSSASTIIMFPLYRIGFYDVAKTIRYNGNRIRHTTLYNILCFHLNGIPFKNTFFRAAFNVYFYMILIMLFYV